MLQFIPGAAARSHMAFHIESSSAPVSMTNTYTRPDQAVHTSTPPSALMLADSARKPEENKATIVQPYLQTTVNEIEMPPNVCFELQKGVIDSALSACLSGPWETRASDSEPSRLGSEGDVTADNEAALRRIRL